MTKIVSISDEVYDALVSLKHENESFTRLFKRFIEQKKKRPLVDFFGTWPGESKELEALKDTLAERRKTFKTRGISL